MSQLQQLRGGQSEPHEAASLSEAKREKPHWQARLKVSSIASVARRLGRADWNEVTQGNKIVLPDSVFDNLRKRGLPYDKFQLLNPEKRDLRIFTGPLDFSAKPGECYLPTWVMKQLGIKEGEMSQSLQQISLHAPM
jgi:hypothetical protein